MEFEEPKVYLSVPTLSACSQHCGRKDTDCWAFRYIPDVKMCQLVMASEGRVQILWFWRQDSGEDFVHAHVSNAIWEKGT